MATMHALHSFSLSHEPVRLSGPIEHIPSLDTGEQHVAIPMAALGCLQPHLHTACIDPLCLITPPACSHMLWTINQCLEAVSSHALTSTCEVGT